MICLSEPMTSSRARIDFSRPTNNGTIMCGKTTMSRSGNTGYVRCSPAGGSVLGFAGLVMTRILLLCPFSPDTLGVVAGEVQVARPENCRGCGRSEIPVPKVGAVDWTHTITATPLGGYRPGMCQVSLKNQRNSPAKWAGLVLWNG